MRLYFLLPCVLTVLGQANASTFTRFSESAFCRQNACTLQARWTRFGKTYLTYTLPGSPNTELSIFVDRTNQPVGATYARFILDDWSDKYGVAAAFFSAVFNTKISALRMKDLDQNQTHFGLTLTDGQRSFTLYKQYRKEPSFSLQRVLVSLETPIPNGTTGIPTPTPSGQP